MIRVAAGDEFIAVGFIVFHMILPRHFQCRFIGFRTAVDIKADFQGSGQHPVQFFRQFDERRGKRIHIIRKEFKRFHLFLYGGGDFRPVVTANRSQQCGKRIEISVPIKIVNIAPFPPRKDFRSFRQFDIAGEMRNHVFLRRLDQVCFFHHG